MHEDMVVSLPKKHVTGEELELTARVTAPKKPRLFADFLGVFSCWTLDDEEMDSALQEGDKGRSGGRVITDGFSDADGDYVLGQLQMRYSTKLCTPQCTQGVRKSLPPNL